MAKGENVEDQELLATLRDSHSEKQGLEKVYQKYSRLVLYIAQQYGLSEEAAEDLVHDVFVRVFQNRTTLSDGTNLKAWISMLARNSAVDYRRKHRKELMIKTTIEKNIAVPLLNPQVVHNVECAVVMQMIEDISCRSKDDCLKQFYIDGLRISEIAQRKNLPLDQMTHQLIQFRGQFKQKIKERMEQNREAKS